MSFVTRLVPVLALGAVAGCTTIAEMDPRTVATATLGQANGIPAGTARLVDNGGRMTLEVAATGLTPGSHGFHLHQTGECRAPDFTSAGGHLNPQGKMHGHLSPGGSHLGDMPNLEVGANRTAATTVDLPGDSAKVLEWIFDGDGTAVVIHAGADDYRTDPAGAAGARVACGVLRKS